ncbi:GNAT family N-acetyltransferase [Streptomyces sp. NPDC059740]|uniref:GNAT family N-acetyltransferase n=1 Tax=Streptomyces sp. NPDC059740 TaxID=3346926 RepID=UPI003660DE01
MPLTTVPRPAAAPAAPRCVTTVSRDPAEFLALGPEWDALRRRCRPATPFQSHAWLASWWRSYGRPGRLRVVLVRQDGRLVAAAALTLAYRPYPVLQPLGGAISDFLDVLVDDACPAAPAELARALRTAARGALLDLRELRPGAAAERLRPHWSGTRWEAADSVCLELPGLPMEDLLRRLPGASAKRTRAKLRRIDRLGICERGVPPAGVADAVGTMLRLHERQWRGRGVTPEHLRPRFAAHLTRATRAMAADGDAVVTEFLLGEEVMACDITFTSEDLVCGYLYGADPRLRDRKVDIATMLLRHDAHHASSGGHRVLSLLRGTESYKQRWRPETVRNRRLLLAPRGLAPVLLLHAAQLTARARVARLVRERADLGWARRLLTRGHPAQDGPS